MWEYMVRSYYIANMEPNELVKILNEWGSAGWELCTIEGETLFIFKRKKSGAVR